MQKQTQARTMSVMLGLIGLILVNTFLSAGLRLYNEWSAWTIYAVGLVLIAVALRFQQRLTTAATVGLLALPFVLAALFSLIGGPIGG